SLVTIPCTIQDTGLIALLAKKLGATSAVIGSVVAALTSLGVDGAAMDEILAGTASFPLLDLMLEANVLAPCSHTGMKTNTQAMAAAAQALTADDARLATASTQAVDTVNCPFDNTNAPDTRAVPLAS